MNILQENRLLLASKSPRRSELLTKANIDFELINVEVEEIFPDNLPRNEVAEYLATLKAKAALPQIGDQDIVLGADSIVLQNGTIYGKPKDRADAIRIIRSLSGSQHQVITGVCLFSKSKQVSFSETAHVFMEELSDEEIEFYVDTYQPYDKAGAYAIQEWIGMCKISKIEGTYSNIMGLPVRKVYQALSQW